MSSSHFIKLGALFIMCLLLFGCGGAQKMTSRSGKGVPIQEPVGEPLIVEGIVDSTISDPVQLTTGIADNGIGTYHPDGDKIVFQSNRDGRWQLYELNLTNGATSQLIETPGNDENPIWSPDGSTLVFVSTNEGDDEWERDIKMYDTYTGMIRPITETPGDDWYPVISDDNSLLFLSERDANDLLPVNEQANSLYYTNIDNISPLLLAGNEKDFKAPTVLDDNRLIVLTSQDELAIFNRNELTTKTITPPYIKCDVPTFSREKGWLAFSGVADNQDHLYLMDLRSWILQEIDPGDYNVRYPQFSPDGNWLLYCAEVDESFQLFRMRLSAEQETTVEVDDPEESVEIELDKGDEEILTEPGDMELDTPEETLTIPEGEEESDTTEETETEPVEDGSDIFLENLTEPEDEEEETIEDSTIPESEDLDTYDEPSIEPEEEKLDSTEEILIKPLMEEPDTTDETSIEPVEETDSIENILTEPDEAEQDSTEKITTEPEEKIEPDTIEDEETSDEQVTDEEILVEPDETE